MTAEEKLQLVHGASGAYVGNVPGIARLGVPDLNLEDGPQGVSDGTLGVTCWPSALTVVASWNTALMGQFAAAMALEERQKGTNIHLVRCPSLPVPCDFTMPTAVVLFFFCYGL